MLHPPLLIEPAAKVRDAARVVPASYVRTDLHSTLYDRCGSSRPLRVELYGDSIMRGLYFDLVELLTGEKADRGWGKRVVGPGKGKRLSVSSGGVSISWAWWTLSATMHLASEPSRLERRAKRTGAVTDKARFPAPPLLTNWSLGDSEAVIVFGSSAHDMRFGSLADYKAMLSKLVHELQNSRIRARAFWLVGAASHVYDDELGCASTAAGAPTHRMGFHRSMLFSSIGAEALKAVVPLLDMWRLTEQMSSRCSKVHYDELYVPRGGPVSRAAANLLLNACCNPRLLAPDLVWRAHDV